MSMKLAPNLEVFFNNLPLPDRIAKMADMGFTGGDLFGLGDKDVAAIARACEKHRFSITMGCTATGIAKGLNNPANHAEIEKSVREDGRRLRDMHGTNLVLMSGDRVPRVADSAQNQAILDGMKRLAPVADEIGITLVLEMLNSRYDHPGYYLDSTELMVDLVRAVGHPRIKALYDIYHAGIMRGNVIEDIRAGIRSIGHFHVAGIPGRHEPKGGEQNYPAICRAIDAAGYDGYIGLEYWPEKDHELSLRETRDWFLGG
jgi:hydroxypyruvate isomerase